VDTPESENTQWFAQEVQAHEPALRAYLRRLVPTLTDVDDIVQESYLRLIRTRETGTVTYPKAYLFATARNAALDLFRRQRVISIQGVGEIERLPVLEDGPSVPETVSHDQELGLLAEAIESLPKRCREVLKLRKIYGLSHKQIAARLEISAHTVNAQVANGVRRCADFLREHGVKREGSHGQR
jgi:RNA polymerase sigma factor (sigma-70 family)